MSLVNLQLKQLSYLFAILHQDQRKTVMKRPIGFKTNKIILVLSAIILTFAVAFPAMAGGPKPPMDTPVISCSESTQASISILVCALDGIGATGAPAGFSIQWMTKADYDLYGWPSDTLSLPTSFCHASFSGNAARSRYNLSPGGCVTVNIGELLFDEGTSTDCPVALDCGTEYVFRTFAHATNSYNRSDFSAVLICSTLSCDGGEGCTYTQGYWKTHGPDGCVTGNNVNEWPVTSLVLGNVSYTDSELCSILNTPGGGNGLITLAHQLIAAKLNVANGSDDTAIAGAIVAADALIGDLVIPPVGGGYLSPSATTSLIITLTEYNEGATGPGHCD